MIKQLWNEKSKWIFVLLTAAVFLFFALITHWTPVSGDDWVYAVGGMWNNPFSRTLVMYQTWSGRVLSELWGFLVAPHKSLWNVLNPLFFTLIFVLLVLLSSDSEHRILTGVFAFFLMLGVGNRLRMQTYTWIMGTTYVIPLLLFLLQLYLLRGALEEETIPKWKTAVLCLLNLCIPLYMENAAALMVGADILVLLYCIFKRKQKARNAVLLFLVFALVGTGIILFSPGASARLTNDNAEFNALSLFEKIAQNWPYFLEHTFTESGTVTKAFVVMSIVFALRYRSEHPLLLGLLAAGAAVCLFDQGWGYLIYLALFLSAVIACETNEATKWYLVYLILCALGADAVMLVSPIFDSRSSLYTVYLILLAALVLFQNVPLKPQPLKVMLFAAGTAGCICFMARYYDIYHMVHLINIRRNQEIEYYRLRPDAGDAWLIAYPDESIHSANVQEGDDTHMYYFKEYYYLSQDLHLVFYYLDEYNASTIFAPKG